MSVLNWQCFVGIVLEEGFTDREMAWESCGGNIIPNMKDRVQNMKVLVGRQEENKCVVKLVLMLKEATDDAVREQSWQRCPEEEELQGPLSSRGRHRAPH